MKMYVIRTNETGFGICYHAKDGLCAREPINAIKYNTIEKAKKACGDPCDTDYYTHEIVPLTVEWKLHEDEVIKIEPEIEDEEE